MAKALVFKAQMKIFFSDLRNFIEATYRDERIPRQDMKLVLAILVIASIRIFFIPDWIPYFGILDILFLLALVFDYFFGVLDQRILLSHYPWGMKSFARLRRVAGFFSLFAPSFIKDNLWRYRKDPF
ncbi:MAG: hypothetical protein ACXVCE_05610 [Bacteriovorax sp.]